MKDKPFFNYTKGAPSGAVSKLVELNKRLEEMYKHRENCKTQDHIADTDSYHRKLERREEYLTGFIDGWRSQDFLVIKKLIKAFMKEHQYTDPECGDTDCGNIQNKIFRVSSRKKWLGTDESWKEAKRNEKQRDKEVCCYICEFIKRLKRELK